MITLLKLTFCFGLLVMNSCVHLERSTSSGYSNSKIYGTKESNDSNSQYSYNSKITESALPINYKLMADLGITPDSLNKPEILKKYELQLTIKNFEKNLSTDREKKQYYTSIPWFKTEEEQLAFLKQPGYEARLLWMRNKNFGKRTTQLDDESAELIEKKDIALGMSQDNVKKSWGIPDTIEIAGNPLYRNERWKYKKYISSTEGYKLQKRIIYFESGKLVGWEQLDE